MFKVLMFHRVLPDELIEYPNAYSDFGTLISQRYFERVLDFLYKEGYSFVTVSDLTTRIARHEAVEHLVALTFDDGYVDNIEFAVPSLGKFDVKATFFPVVEPCRLNSVLPLDIYYQGIDDAAFSSEERLDAISGKQKKHFYWLHPREQSEYLMNNLSNLPQPNQYRVGYLNVDQLKKISECGHEIGSHGLTHALFTADYMTDQLRLKELKESKKWLEEIIGKTVDSFCFPAGRYYEKHLDMVKWAGYRSACLVKKNRHHDFPAYERVFVKPDALDELKSALMPK